jgi:hypothetical protein
LVKNLKPGTYQMSCPNDSGNQHTFELTILTKKDPSEELEKINRAPSSVEENQWIPRDEGDSYFHSNNLESSPREKKDTSRKYHYEVSNYEDSYESYFEGGL